MNTRTTPTLSMQMTNTVNKRKTQLQNTPQKRKTLFISVPPSCLAKKSMLESVRPPELAGLHCWGTHLRE